MNKSEYLKSTRKMKCIVQNVKFEVLPLKNKEY